MIELTLEKWVNNGYCIAHKNNHTYFIKGGIPGEVVNISITKETKNHSFGEVENILVKSNIRIESDCSVYPKCGGCFYRHIDYKNEIELKKNILIDEFRFRNISFDFKNSEQFLITFGNPNNYRNTVQLHSSKNSIGFYQTNTNNLIPFPKEGCKLLNKQINNSIQKMDNPSLKWRSSGESVVDYSKNKVKFNIIDKELSIPSDGFFQVNSNLIEVWIKTITESLIGNSCIEFFCGSGLITIFASDFFSEYLGYELSSESVKSAISNLNQTKNSHVKIKKLDLYKSKLITHNKFDYCIANPPRAGLGKNLLSTLLDIQPNHILYSSCNYNTLAMDLGYFIENYEIKKIHIFDFFPRTPHFETIVVLKKNK